MSLLKFKATPVGLSVWASNGKVTKIKIHKKVLKERQEFDSSEDRNTLLNAKTQLKQYLAGKSEKLNFPIEIQGTEFEKEVYKALQKIPYGKTASYGEIAQKIGRAGAARAVGGANNKNNLPLIIPCHRIVGSDGKLVGFAGGVDIKKSLLNLEGHEISNERICS